MRAVRIRIFALLAALVLLLPGGAAAARTQYYCRMMGGLVASCCCNGASPSATPTHAQELRDEDCCQRISPATRSASLGTREVAHVVAAVALPAVHVSFVARPGSDTGAACIESTQAPLAIGPPLFLANCALLS